jgi:hypothetical protein
VETDDRQTEDGGRGARSEDNVVRLPRDWLGPREELVPVGSAVHAGGTTEHGSVETLPPTAHDFWGEDSAALHDAMQATQSEHRVEDPAAPTSRVREPRRRRWHRPRLTSRRGIDRLGARRRWLVLGLPAATLLVAVAVIGEAEGPAGAPVRLSSLASPAARQTQEGFATGTSVTGTPVALARARSLTLRVRSSRPTARRSPGAAHSRRAHTRHPAHRRIVRHRSSTSSVAARATTQSPAASATTYTSPTPAPVSPAPRSAAATGSSPQSSPVRPAAFGPGGALGPGSSPDS